MKNERLQHRQRREIIVFANIFNQAQSVVVKSKGILSRTGSKEEKELVDDAPWQEADCKFTIFDFTTTCAVFVFLLFLNLYY